MYRWSWWLIFQFLNVTLIECHIELLGRLVVSTIYRHCNMQQFEGEEQMNHFEELLKSSADEIKEWGRRNCGLEDLTLVRNCGSNGFRCQICILGHSLTCISLFSAGDDVTSFSQSKRLTSYCCFLPSLSCMVSRPTSSFAFWRRERRSIDQTFHSS